MVLRRFGLTMLGAAVLAAAPLLAGPASAQQQELRIALRQDPDILDPTFARTYVSRIVFAGMCDKLFDINENLTIVPQLALSYEWGEDNKSITVKLRPNVKFHDGEPMDAEAVRYSLNRHLTMQGSFRRAEIASMESVEVVDPLTVRIKLKVPFAPFLAQLTDRAGMIVSPKAAEAAGKEFGQKPVCAGPFKFVERVAQDRIVVERFADYWNKDAIHFDKITYLAIYDSTVRLANLQAGSIDLVETVAPNDMQSVRRNPRLKLAVGDELGYQRIEFNVANGERAKTPIGQDARVRQAFDLAIDRAALNQVVFNGEYTITGQWVPPDNPLSVPALKPPQRDVAKAKALLSEAGVKLPVPLELMVPNDPESRQVGEVIQSMTKEVGFNVTVRATEFATALTTAEKGDFEAFLIPWSGRTDTDGNIYSFVTCKGPQNDGRYCNPEVDALLDKARAVPDEGERRALYGEVGKIALQKDYFAIYLWHRKNIVGHTARLTGFKPVPDGLIRLQGVKMAGN